MNCDGKTPEIRFRGFDGEWETRKLGDISTSYSGGTPAADNKAYYGGNIPFIRSGEISANSTELFLTDLGLNNSSAAIVEKGDILYALYGATSGEVSRSKINGAINQAILAIKPIKGFDAEYIKQWLRNNKEEIISTYLQGGQGNLSGAIVKELQITLPSLAEQQQIGAFFERLDALITLYRRRREQLSNVKKSLLEKMFPREGAKVPEIRFAGFVGEWETRKLGELASFSKGAGYTKNDLKENGTPIILYGRLYTQYETVITDVDTFADKKANAVYSRGGEVIVPASGETAEDISIASVVSKSGILLGGDLNVIWPCEVLDSVFLAINISYGAPHYQMAKMAQGKSIVHLHNSDLEKIDFVFPALEEQKQIGDFFQELDGLLALSDRRLRKLENVKKSFLSKLFVSSSASIDG